MKRLQGKPERKPTSGGKPPKLPAARSTSGAGDAYHKFVTKAEAADFLRTSVRTVERLIKAGRLQSRKLLRTRLIPRSSLRAFVSDVEATA